MEFEATVTRHEDGNVYDINGNAGEGEVCIISGGTVLKDGCYVYVYAVNDEGLIPGVSETGYGIYKLPFIWDEEETATIMVEAFGLVYPLEEKSLL